MLFNLLQNARNHTEGGTVTITAETDGGFVAVTVADTGGGVSPELLPRIFERGASASENGSGIGLAVCKEIIDGYGGTIRVKNRPGGRGGALHAAHLQGGWRLWRSCY